MSETGRVRPPKGPDELSTLLARAYVRLLAAQAEEGRTDAVSAPENRPNPLEVSARKWPPPVDKREARRR